MVQEEGTGAMACETRPALRAVVGLGASAGGLAAFNRFLEAVPADTGLAFVVVQHLDPTQDSLLAELLSRHTPMPVVEVTDGMRLQPGRVHVLPPNAYVTLEGEVLRLKPPTERRGMRLAVDIFLRSLADAYDRRAVGVVLSGTGYDGVAGLRAVRVAGGLTLAQDPATAQHDGMPAHAIAADVVDIVLPVEQLPQAILRYIEHDYAMPDWDAGSDGDDRDLLPVVRLLSARAGYPLHAYKTSMLRRRVFRRMGFRQVATLEQYLDLLRNDPAEPDQLLRDLLIGVTEFFRDVAAFETLDAEVITPMVERAARDATLRLWVAGCSTGEEAYSLAMLVLEHIEQRRPDLRLQVFATDIDDVALRAARTGIYPASSLVHLSAERIARHFHGVGDGYQINQSLRDCVSFAVHNLLRDPPFSRMDLVSCRNLLIYIKPELQRDILSLFHFALNQDGCLFLGTSEGIGRMTERFAPVSKPWRIYRRIGTGRATRATQAVPASFRHPLESIGRPRRATTAAGAADERASERLLLDACVPPAVVVDSMHLISYLHGNLRDYLAFPDDASELDLMRMLPATLRPRVRAALHHARRTGEPVTLDASFPHSGRDGATRLTVSAPQDERGHAVITFTRLERSDAPMPVEEAPSSPAMDDSLTQLESELQMTRAQLREAVENLETSTEELKSSNEEGMAMNEELQATNEELEATTEELRSVNEELVTVNAQLKEKVGELVAANNDIFNLLASTKLAILFLDNDQRIRRYTASASELLGLAPADLGRHIQHLAGPCLDGAVVEDARAVRESLVPRECELHLPGGRTFLRRILPYRTEDDRIAGVVITFSDVSRLHAVSEFLRVRERQQAALKDFSLRALSGESVPRLREEAVTLVANTLGCELGEVLELREDGNLALVAQVGWQLDGPEPVLLPAGRGSHGGYAIAQQAPVVVNDFESEVRFTCSRPLRAQGARSGIATVIQGEKGPAGVLGAHARSVMAFNQYDVAFVESVANILANAMRLVRDRDLILESESRYRALAEAFPQLVWTTDGAGRLDYVNAFYRRFTGLSLEQAIEGGWRELLHPEDLPKVDNALGRSLLTGEPFELEYRLRDPSGEYRWFLGKSLSIRDATGQVARRVGAAVDINAIKRADEALREVDRRKNEFLAMLSHELRNPLAPLLAASNILPRIADDPHAIRDQAAIVRRQVMQMKRLLDDLLDLARVARGSMTLQQGPVDLNEVVRNAAESVAPMVAERRASLDLQLPAEPVVVLGDAARLTQAVANLLNNAVKYGGAGVRVTASVERRGTDALVAVRDTGRGIEPERISRLFEEFEQGDRAIDRSEGGLGLGLALVRRIVDLHDGRAWADSAGLGHGSVFTIALQLPQGASLARLEEQAASQAPAMGMVPRLLVVDDNVDAAFLHSEYLRLLGYETRTAGDGQTALDLALSWGPHAILLDIGLPGLDGYEVARRLRQQLPRQALVLIAVTGYGQESDRQRALQAGFNFHFTKPVDLDFIDQVLRESLAQRADLAGAVRRPESPAAES